jgi:hypothetical protein
MISDGFNETLYSYEMSNNLDELKELYKNVTFIDFPEDELNFLYKKFNLNRQKDKIHVVMMDYTSNDERTATSDYSYRFFLENNTELNLSLLDEDIYVDFYVPIKDLDLANFNQSKYFSDQGFDIYNKSSAFYNDFCTPAHQGENDMTLKDRKKDIYPNNVTLCKANCEYNGVDLENKRVICSCNLNENKEGNATEDFLAEDNGNFFSYLLDNINYKIFKCYILWRSFSNLQYNIAFYTILGIIVIVIVLNLVFIFHTLPTLKGLIIKEIPTKESLRRDILEELKKIRQTSQNTLNNPNKKKTKKTSKGDEKVFEKIIDIDQNEKNQKKKKRKMRTIMNKKISNPSLDRFITKTNSEKEKEKEQETEKVGQ